MKISASTKIAAGFVVLVGGGYLATRVITDRAIMHKQFSEITPGALNIIGIDPGAGYQINIANQVATLVQVQGGFGADSGSDAGATQGAVKGRLPLSDMLKAMQGDTKALGEFISSLNNMKENESWPPIRVVWTAAQLAKALDGDPKAQTQLENDLNMKLDGAPLSQIRFPSIENGIIVQVPVRVNVGIGGGVKELIGEVQQPFKPTFIRTLEQQYEEKPNITKELITGYYMEAAKEVNQGKSPKEDIRSILRHRIDPKNTQQLAVRPEQILKSAKIVVNDSMIEEASYHEYEGASGKLYDLKLQLSDEGRERLWQFSKPRVGFQLLIVSGGVGIAAPKIDHQLMFSELTVTQLPDERLLKDAIKSLHDAKSKQTKQDK